LPGAELVIVAPLVNAFKQLGGTGDFRFAIANFQFEGGASLIWQLEIADW
jgi:hypothetical protein